MGSFRRADWKTATLLCLALAGVVTPPARAGEGFTLRDGDTVVFLGDSITAARTYGKVVENYTLLRFPDREVHFVNAGWGGDTAEGGLKRLERDVFAQGATVVTVAYGVNDIGWGTRADDEHRKRYLDGIRGIVTACRDRGVRVYVCSAAITAENPNSAESGFLQRMNDEGMALSRSLGGGAIDVQRVMRSIQRRVLEAAESSKDPKDRPTLHAPDGVHLNDLGQLAMAYALLKGLGAPAEVSSATVDARSGAVVASTGCRVTNVSVGGSHLEFDRLDDGLPINFGPLGALQFRFIPVPDGLNRYLLTVRNLPTQRYRITVDGRPLGAFSAGDLARGVNLASATADGWEPGGPWDAQAAVLISLTDARNDLAQGLKMADHWVRKHPANRPLHRGADDTNARLESLQRVAARPRTYRFVISPEG